MLDQSPTTTESFLGNGVLATVLVVLPVLDTLTGLGIGFSGGGKLLRVVLLFGGAVTCLVVTRESFFEPEVLLTFGFLISATVTLLTSGPQPGDVAFTLKVAYIPVAYLTIVRFLARGWLDERALLRALWLSALVFLALTYSLYAVGLGRGLYTSTGFKGAFVAGNEVVIALTVLYPVVLCFALERGRLYWIVVPPMVLLMLALASKASIGGVLLETVLVPLVWGRAHRRSLLRTLIPPFVLMVGTALAAVVALTPLLRSIVVNRLAASGGPGSTLTTFILSHRNEVLARAGSEFLTRLSPIKLFFGWGFSGAASLGSGALGLPKFVEIDPVDTFLSFGLVGTLFLGGFWVCALIRVFDSWRNNPGGSGTPAMGLIPVLVLESLFAGHVVYSTIAGTALATLLAVGSGSTMRIVS